MFVTVESLNFGDYTAEFGEVDEFKLDLFFRKVIIKFNGNGWHTFELGHILTVLRFG